jgi:hypothetical protein
MIHRYILSVVSLLLLVSSVALSGTIREGSFTGRSDGSNIVLQWVSDDESGVARFELERKSGVNGQFLFLVSPPLRGSNSSYIYVDDSAFLRATESIYQYRIKVVFANGSSEYFGPITVPHSVSSTVRRTWGSIKAMFR